MESFRGAVSLPINALRVAAGFALFATLPVEPAHATILLFDQERDAASQTMVGPDLERWHAARRLR